MKYNVGYKNNWNLLFFETCFWLYDVKRWNDKYLFVSYIVLQHQIHEIFKSKGWRKMCKGVLLWWSRLKIWLCHFSGLGCCCGSSSVPSPRTSICCRQKKKKFKVFQKSLCIIYIWKFFIPSKTNIFYKKCLCSTRRNGWFCFSSSEILLMRWCESWP